MSIRRFARNSRLTAASVPRNPRQNSCTRCLTRHLSCIWRPGRAPLRPCRTGIWAGLTSGAPAGAVCPIAPRRSDFKRANTPLSRALSVRKSSGLSSPRRHESHCSPTRPLPSTRLEGRAVLAIMVAGSAAPTPRSGSRRPEHNDRPEGHQVTADVGLPRPTTGLRQSRKRRPATASRCDPHSRQAGAAGSRASKTRRPPGRRAP